MTLKTLSGSRRQFISRAGVGLGTAAIGSLLQAEARATSKAVPGLPGLPHFAPKAKRAVFLFMSGAPSQLETFDYKPELRKRFGQDLPESIRKGQRLTAMSAAQSKFPLAPSKYNFSRAGKSGTWVSELLPHTAKIVDELAIIRSMHTEAINHDPAITFISSGSQLPGRPSLGAWLSYGLGSENENLPSFVVLKSISKMDQPIFSRLWGSGFLPSRHQGVALRSSGDPVLYLSNPEGVDSASRRRALDALGSLNQGHFDQVGDPEIQTRIAQYEMAFRMQSSVPDLCDLSGETEATLALYGPDVKKPGTFAYNCLLTRRMMERGVRFVELFHRGWDLHDKLPTLMPAQCRDIDHATAGFITDLKQRGLLDDTLVIWGGEFGRTAYCQGQLTNDDYGRDHHPRCFTMWMAGGGIKGGVNLGQTDPFSYNIEIDPVHVHDLNATILHCLGIDHERLTYRYQGRDFRLTDVHGKVVKAILA
jgi:hypothetical protein